MLPRIDGTARASFAGSNQLAQQARQGFPFDVFLSASPQHTQALFAEGLVRKPVGFATNSLVLIVPRSNPARIASVADLAKRAMQEALYRVDTGVEVGDFVVGTEQRESSLKQIIDRAAAGTLKDAIDGKFTGQVQGVLPLDGKPHGDQHRLHLVGDARVRPVEAVERLPQRQQPGLREVL